MEPCRSVLRCLFISPALQEAAGDPFGALFAQRTPGLAAPRRVASKKGRKIATEA